MPKTQVSITLDEDLVNQIDDERGLITRSAYIEMLLEKILKKEKKT